MELNGVELEYEFAEMGTKYCVPALASRYCYLITDQIISIHATQTIIVQNYNLNTRFNNYI